MLFISVSVDIFSRCQCDWIKTIISTHVIKQFKKTKRCSASGWAKTVLFLSYKNICINDFKDILRIISDLHSLKRNSSMTNFAYGCDLINRTNFFCKFSLFINTPPCVYPRKEIILTCRRQFNNVYLPIDLLKSQQKSIFTI